MGFPYGSGYALQSLLVPHKGFSLLSLSRKKFLLQKSIYRNIAM